MGAFGNIMEQWEENRKNRNRILILSLGTGNMMNKTQKTAQEVYADGTSVYQATKYQMIGRNESTEARFVAQLLIKEVNPDMVILIGTVKSAWSGIYKEYYHGAETNVPEDVFAQLYDKEKEYGIHTDEKTIDDFQDYINLVYKEAGIFRGLCKDIETKVIITKYGVTGIELADNYRRLSEGIMDCLNVEVPNLISFDITHSFRSMPLYNLIILNYIKSITEYGVEIEHIYYGNLEINKENSGVSLVSDLGELSDVLSLTSAVAEFKNSGNANSLIALLPDEIGGEKIKEKLEAFDGAAQINNLLKMEESLKRLIISVRRANERKSNPEKYQDACRMIGEVLKENLPSEADFQKMEDMEKNPLSYAKIQTKVGRWSMKTNHLGQAMLIATEAFKSCFVPFYLSQKNQQINMNNCSNDEKRKKSEDIQELILNECRKYNRERVDWLSANNFNAKAKYLRNTYAHILSSNWSYGKKEIEEFCSEFYDSLDALEQIMEQHWEEIVNKIKDPIFENEHILKISGMSGSKKSYIGILIDVVGNDNKAQIKKEEIQDTNKTYRVKVTGRGATNYIVTLAGSIGDSQEEE